MTDTTENNEDRVNFRDELSKDVVVIILFCLFSCFFDYLAFFKTPTYSVLSCHKNFINRTYCELGESYILDCKLHTRSIGNIQKAKLIRHRNSGTIFLKTELPWLGGSIKNIYFPNSAPFISPLILSNKKAKTEVKRINSYISRHNRLSKLKVVCKISLFSFFTYIFLIFLLFANFPFVVVILMLAAFKISDGQEQ